MKNKVSNPQLSIILPVFNAQDYLEFTIQSILQQTFANFELIIIDDGSTDNSLSLIKGIKDERIVLLSNKQKLGIARTLNIGIKKARGEFIVRIDADDRALPKRLEKQLSYLKQNPGVGVLGTSIEFINEGGNVVAKKRMPKICTKIALISGYKNSIIHPTVMLRKKLITRYGAYDEGLDGAEDKDLWMRFSQFTQIENLPDVLMQYRTHRKSVSFSSMQKVQKAFIQAQFKAIFSYGYSVLYLPFVLISIASYTFPSQLKKRVYEIFFSY